MSKWNSIFNNSLTKTKCNSTKFAKVIRNTKSLDAEALKKAGNEAYAEKIAAEDSLVAALEANTLKSKSLIAQAESIKSAREKKAKSQKENHTK